MKNAIEDANFELDGIYELLADWGNLRMWFYETYDKRIIFYGR
jgi:hypothetical protein